MRSIYFKISSPTLRQSCDHLIVPVPVKQPWSMVTSWNGNIFRVTDPLFGEFTGGSPVDSLHKDQWSGALIFPWSAPEHRSNTARTNSRDAGGLGHHRAHYDVTVMRIWVKLVGYTIKHMFIFFRMNSVTRPLMMTSWCGNVFRITDTLIGEFNGYRSMSLTKGQKWRDLTDFCC